MNEPRSTYLTLRGREIHITEWGDPGKPALVMWHGLARTGRDFDTIASALSGDYYVLAPDTLGRGLSQWATDPAAEYRLDAFGATAMAMLDRLGIAACRWIGTSMGGAIGIYLAGGPMRQAISHLVINDIGPELPASAVERIATYVGNPPGFSTITALEAWFRKVYAPFGPMSDGEWRRLTETSARRLPSGEVTPHYDPRIVAQFEAGDGLGDQWSSYDAIVARILLLRGAESDLLTEDTATAMTRRQPQANRIDLPGIGHAPPLNTTAQIDAIRTFLAS